jgi:hypothetical protein
MPLKKALMKYVLFLILLTVSASAQVVDILPYSLNQEPGDFYSVENEFAKIVFKKKYQARAFRALDAITSHSKNIQKGFIHKPQKVTIFLRSKTMQSNGFVALAPFKSEFFDAPYLQGQLDLGEWMEMLAIHEYRHVVQLSQRVEGFSKAIYIFMGEFGLALSNVWSTPLWAFEGDATRAETIYTEFGRGRNAAFSRRFRATLSKELGYEDYYVGTPYKFVPDFYKFGYFFLEFLLKKYNYNVEEAFSRTSRNSYNPFSFQNSIKDHTGKPIDDLVTEFISYYQNIWANKVERVGIEVTGKDTFETDYRFPFINSKGKLFTIKSGIADRRQLQSSENILHYPGSFVSNFMNNDKDTLYWIEPRRHWRFNTMSQNAVCYLNSLSGDQKCSVLTGKETGYDKRGRLSVVSLFDGKSQILIKDGDRNVVKLNASTNSVYVNPQFIDDNRIIYIYKNSLGLFSLRSFSLDSQKETILFQSGTSAIRRHKVFKNKVVFESELSSIEEIYELDIRTKTLRRLTNSRVASLYPFIKDDHLYFSRMTNNGFKIFKQPLSIDFPVKSSVESYVLSESTPLKLKNNEYKVQEYSDDSFNFHSWVLVPPLFSPSFSLTAISGNESETIEIQAGASYRSSESSGGLFALGSFKKYLIQFDVGASFDKRASDDSGEDFVWDETNLFAGPKFSSQFNWGQWYSRFFLATYLNQVEVLNKKNTDSREFSDGKINGGILRTGFDIQAAKNRLRPYSPLSFSLNYVLRDLRSETDEERGKLSTIKSSVTFGIEKATGVRISYGHEVQLKNKYRFISELIQSRGFSFSYSPDFETFQFDIKRPIIDKKLKLGKFAYFNRFDIGLFHDRMRYSSQDFSSTGLELTTNIYFFRTLPAPLGVGARYLRRVSNDEYKDDENPIVLEFFLSSVTTF